MLLNCYSEEIEVVILLWKYILSRKYSSSNDYTNDWFDCKFMSIEYLKEACWVLEQICYVPFDLRNSKKMRRNIQTYPRFVFWSQPQHGLWFFELDQQNTREGNVGTGTDHVHHHTAYSQELKEELSN